MAMTEDQVLGKVRKLIARAEHEGTPPKEAESCYAMADQLMINYAIDRDLLNQSLPEADKLKPETIVIALCKLDAPLKNELAQLAETIASFARVRIVYYGYGYRMDKYQHEYYTRPGNEDQLGDVQMKVFGFKGELKYFEFMWTQIYLHVASGMEAKPDFSKSLEWNCRMLHNVGYNWLDIAYLYGWDKQKQYEYPDVKVPYRNRETGVVSPATMVGSSYKRAYYREIKRLGEPRLSIPASGRVTFYRNFVKAYKVRITDRIAEAERHRTHSQEIQLSSSFEEVMKMYQEEVGDAKPRKNTKLQFNPEAWERGVRHADTADLGGTRVGSETNRRPIE